MKYSYKFDNTKKNYGARYKLRLDKHDSWDFGCTLSPVILPMLKQLRKNKKGTPLTDKLDVPFLLQLDPEEKHEGFSEKRWAWILDEMIFSFNHTYKCQNDPDYNEDYFYATGAIEYIGKNMKEGKNHTYKCDDDKMFQFYQRVDRGFVLFGKYFQNLVC